MNTYIIKIYTLGPEVYEEMVFAYTPSIAKGKALKRFHLLYKGGYRFLTIKKVDR